MVNRRFILLALSLTVLLSVFQASALSPQTKHIPGLHVVKQLPKTMVAGSTYEWQVSFVNPKSESGSTNITLEIVEKKTSIGLGEFKVEGTLESYDKPPRKHQVSTLTFTEISGGKFQTQTNIDYRFNDITLKISSVPNLMPGKYTFTLIITIQYKDKNSYQYKTNT